VNRLGDKGARVFAGVLEGRRNLKVLDLTTNRISDGGASALANSLEHNQILEGLLWHLSKVGSDGAIALAADALSTSEPNWPRWSSFHLGDVYE
jgi:Ran GTPase-activating protein (RanGAP) involved in mRNA processing and transport